MSDWALGNLVHWKVFQPSSGLELDDLYGASNPYHSMILRFYKVIKKPSKIPIKKRVLHELNPFSYASGFHITNPQVIRFSVVTSLCLNHLGISWMPLGTATASLLCNMMLT